MATGQKPDPRRRGTKHAHATHLQCKGGEKHSAWKAGGVHGVYGHRTFAHQPCVQLVTGGKLQCPYCAAGVKLEWRGYVPLWDVDWVLRYVLIGEDIFESVEETAFRAPVVVQRHKNPISPLVVRPFASLERELPNRPPWDKEVDMLSICLTLWEHDDLSNWYATQRTAEPKEATVQLRGDGTPFSPPYQAAARRWSTPPDTEQAGKALDAVTKSLKEKAAKLPPSTNGKKPH